MMIFLFDIDSLSTLKVNQTLEFVILRQLTPAVQKRTKQKIFAKIILMRYMSCQNFNWR